MPFFGLKKFYKYIIIHTFSISNIWKKKKKTVSQLLDTDLDFSYFFRYFFIQDKNFN